MKIKGDLKYKKGSRAREKGTFNLHENLLKMKLKDSSV
jgi:hypothetical protein